MSADEISIQVFADRLERRLKDFKTDHNIEVLSDDDRFLDDLLDRFNKLYDAATEQSELQDSNNELKDLLREINNLTVRY